MTREHRTLFPFPDAASRCPQGRRSIRELHALHSPGAPSAHQDARKFASINIFAARATFLAGPRTPGVWVVTWAPSIRRNSWSARSLGSRAPIWVQIWTSRARNFAL